MTFFSMIIMVMMLSSVVLAASSASDMLLDKKVYKYNQLTDAETGWGEPKPTTKVPKPTRGPKPTKEPRTKAPKPVKTPRPIREKTPKPVKDPRTPRPTKGPRTRAPKPTAGSGWGVSVPRTPRPVTSEPTTSEPTRRPTTPMPTTSEPTTSEPTHRPTTPRPTTASPTTASPTEKKAADQGECASGYKEQKGDCGGWTSVDGAGGGESVSTCQGCADLCSERSACNSYECSVTELKCNLNTQVFCSPHVYKDYMFCSKKPTTSEPTTSEPTHRPTTSHPTTASPTKAVECTKGSTPGKPGWYKAAMGDTCDETCCPLSLKCDADMQSTITSAAAVREAFADAGYTCRSADEHHHRAYEGAPFSTERVDDCYFLTPGARSVCGAIKYSNSAPLCYCGEAATPFEEVLTLGTNPETIWQTIDIGEHAFNHMFAVAFDAGFPIIRVECPQCLDSHKLIFYKRLSAIGSFNAYANMASWMSASNVLNTDFALYSTWEDVINDENRWAFCNYDDVGVGFPRDCGVSGGIGGQWTSSTRGGKNAMISIWSASAKKEAVMAMDVQANVYSSEQVGLAGLVSVCTVLMICAYSMLSKQQKFEGYEEIVDETV